ncbi:MAG TPA: alpha-amylase family glycosyl hydrolase [Mycobacteriales bacterium]|nr:alpha-amylase family glycosyl hydrolase [Mycobacteriales bacterium]
MPQWVEHVVWWQVAPLGFTGAEPVAVAEVHHRLPALEGWLDHLIALGCNGLLLGPVFAAGTHGYDTVDWFRIDPRLGDDADFDALVAACRARGVRLLLDGVFNHAGRDFPPVAKALAEGPGSDAEDWVARLHDNGGMITADYFEGHSELVTLNHRSPRVQQHVRDVMTHWLRRGADGWRLDAAYAVPPEFWAAVLPAVRAEFGEAWFVGEMIHGDYVGYVRASGLDSVTEYELWKAIWSSLDSVNLHELDWTLGRHAGFVERFVPLTFLGNHDVTRVAAQISDPRHRSHAVALLLFLPGVPSVYYGDEFGLEAVKEDRAGGDDAIRPALPADRATYVNPHPEVEEWYRRLIGLRRRHPWLVDAVVSTSEVANDHLRVHCRARHGDESLTLALNLSDDPLPVRGEILAGSGDPHGWAITGA